MLISKLGGGIPAGTLDEDPGVKAGCHIFVDFKVVVSIPFCNRRGVRIRREVLFSVLPYRDEL